MMCGHFDHPTNYIDFFAASCGSIGDFKDTKKRDLCDSAPHEGL